MAEKNGLSKNGEPCAERPAGPHAPEPLARDTAPGGVAGGLHSEYQTVAPRSAGRAAPPERVFAGRTAVHAFVVRCHSICCVDVGVAGRTALREGLFEQPLAERRLSVRRGRGVILADVGRWLFFVLLVFCIQHYSAGL